MVGEKQIVEMVVLNVEKETCLCCLNMEHFRTVGNRKFPLMNENGKGYDRSL